MSDTQTGTTAAPGSRSRRVWIGAGAAVAVLAVPAVLSVLGAGRGPSSVGPAPGPAAAAAAPGAPGDPLSMGSPTAPITVVQFGDFQCTFCGALARGVEPALRAQYVDTGRVRFQWRDFAYLGPQSQTAAVAARAAGRQGKFWAYHDALYAAPRAVNSGALSPGYLLDTARRLGLDPARFQADPALAGQVQADRDAGSAAGVVGTPTFLINGKLLFGAQPLAVFQQDIDTALAGSGASR